VPYLAKALDTLAIILGVTIGSAKGSLLVFTSLAHQLQSSGGRKRLLYGEPADSFASPTSNGVTYESEPPVAKTLNTNPLFVPDVPKGKIDNIQAPGIPAIKKADIQPLSAPVAPVVDIKEEVDTKKEDSKISLAPPTPTPSPAMAPKAAVEPKVAAAPRTAVPAIPVTEVHQTPVNGHAKLHNEKILATDQSLTASEVHSTVGDNETEDGYTDETGSIRSSQPTTPRSTTENITAPKKKTKKSKKIMNKLKKVFT
jgi:hypothetical protein